MTCLQTANKVIINIPASVKKKIQVNGWTKQEPLKLKLIFNLPSRGTDKIMGRRLMILMEVKDEVSRCVKIQEEN